MFFFSLLLFHFSHLPSKNKKNKKKVVDCCAPQLLNLEDELYTESDTNEVEDTCYHSDCDESFFTDIAASLNSMGSPLIGCASGLGVCSSNE